MFGMRTRKLNKINERRFFWLFASVSKSIALALAAKLNFIRRFNKEQKENISIAYIVQTRSRIFRTFFYYVYIIFMIYTLLDCSFWLGVGRVKYPARRKCCAKCKNGSTFALFILRMLSAFNIWFWENVLYRTHIKMETMVPHEYFVNTYIYTQNAHKFKSNGKNNLINSRLGVR